MDVKKGIERAFAASKRAYIPYSHFAVGAAIEMNDGTWFEGCNVENAAYGSTMCAERNAIYQAYCQGYRKEDIHSLTIVAYGKEVVTPCGACRQVLAELMLPETPIILANPTKHLITNIKALLPGAFLEEDLHV